MQITGKCAIAWLALALAAAAAGADQAAVKASYDKMCASCHGADGRGNAAKAKALKIEARLLDLGREEARAIPAAEKKRILLEGKAKMPGYASKLAPAEVDPMLAYCVAIVAATRPPAAAPPAAAAPPPPAAAPPPVVAAAGDAKAKAIWKKRCASCHATDGGGKAAKAKTLKLAAGTLDLGREATASLAPDEKRTIVATGKGKMPAFGKKLKPAEVDVVTAYAVELAAGLRAKRK